MADDAVLGAHPGTLAPGLIRWLYPLLRVVRACHRPTLDGFDNLPPAGPFILVTNHSAAIGQAEILSFVALYLDALGARALAPDARPLVGFAHWIGFGVPGLGRLLRAAGAVPSTYEAAEAVLAAGLPLLVFPGGDHETLRPVWHAHRVDFGDHRGFLRLARGARVPIVPMGIRGSHFTAPMLLRSRALATLLVLPRLIGMHRWGISVLGVLLTAAVACLPVPLYVRVVLAYLVITSGVQFVAWVPWTIRFRIGPPIAAEALFTDDDADLAKAYAHVEGAVQALVRRG